MRDAKNEWVSIVEYIGELAGEAGLAAASIREQLYSDEDRFAVQNAVMDRLTEHVTAGDMEDSLHSAELLMIGHQWCADHIRRAIENPRGRC